MLDIIGGSYIENCIDPSYKDLFGSGLRAACALSNKNFEINFYSCICERYKQNLELKSQTFGFNCCTYEISRTIEFDYYHPLSKPDLIYDPDLENINANLNSLDNVLYYGMVEAKFKFEGNYVVYDPQNHKRFYDTGSTAKHLALVLNKNEATILATIKNNDLNEIGKSLLKTENAEVVIIKNGSHGALVFEKESVNSIPIFETSIVWPIGSGDIFSAVFAWKWMIEKKSPLESAMLASKYTAQFCQTQHLPLIETFLTFKSISKQEIKRKIYLAAPFYTLSERWLVNEIRNTLLDFGNDVFSPFHDVGLTDSTNLLDENKRIAKSDLDSLKECNTVLAVISGLDAGTLFEIGHAIALDKKVVIYSENVQENDLTMLLGSGCDITSDFSTAIYKASW